MSAEWKEFPLLDVFDVTNGLSKSREEFGFGYPFLTFKEIFNSYFVPEDLINLANTTEAEREKCSIKRGDVFITRTSEKFDELGITCVALKDYPDATFNGFTKRLRPNNSVEIDPEYSSFYFKSLSFRRQVLSLTTMTTRASLNNEMLERLTILLPPVEKQKEVAKILGDCHKKIELNRKTNQTLEQIAQALFKSWFVDFEPTRAKIAAKEAGASPEEIERAAMCAISGKTPEQLAQLPPETQKNLKTTAALFPDSLVDSELGEIPAGWTLPFFDDLVVAKQGRYLSKDEMHILPSRDFQIPVWGGNGVLGYTTKKSYNEPIVLLTCRGSNCGLVRYTESEAWVSNNAFACLPNFGSTFFLLTYFRFESFDDCVSGSAQPQITYSALKTKKMKYPIESKLCNEFSRILDSSFLQILANSAEMKELADTRDLVLPRLLSGELIAL